MAAGQLQIAHFFENTGGLNTADSPFRVQNGQATGGYNYDYATVGGIVKRYGHTKINTAADTQLKTLGLALYNTATGTKFNVRAAGTKLQNLDYLVPSFTSLTEDTASASSNFLTSGTTQPVVFSQFNDSTNNVLWAAGGGMSALNGIYSSSKVTANGAAIATGSLGLSQAAGAGTFVATGTYYYAATLRKASTQAESNAALDVSIVLAATTNVVTISLASLGAIDHTKYDAIILYRSALNGAKAFTTGDIVSTTSITSGIPASITDTGSAQELTVNVPRANNVILDNSALPTGTYNVLTVFKRRLVTAKGSTLYLSDENKPESWPGTNVLTVPSGGPITGLAVISFTSPQAQSLDELLVIFKERELWVITGDDYTDWVLKQIDLTGCPSQALVVSANGFLAWLDYRGIYLWDGAGKPVYCSRPIEPLFAKDGDINKPKLPLGCGKFFRKQNQIVWFLTSRIFGEQQIAIKLDLRLTLPNAAQAMTGRILDGVFMLDRSAIPVYACDAYLPSTSTEEMFTMGDASGFVYNGYSSYGDAGSGYPFSYQSRYHDCGSPGTVKQFHKVIVWAQQYGAIPLQLDYWAAYQSPDASKTTQSETMGSADGSVTALWDLALWDLAAWDDASVKVVPVTFNLNAGTVNANKGDCLKIQFRNSTLNQPVRIMGYSIVYSEIGNTH